ncbi:hypothetical protein E2C01_035529 [Portunus trituberculatus]|uniref:Uncharacterized protein n=1 Tax=Portunus trituberculatus TaxID=210409 RepID=A0A5B7F9K7_PORTR|nr:hypothetical protein [Portunus trituberculatus]
MPIIARDSRERTPCGLFTEIYGLKGILFGYPLSQSPPARKSVPRVRKPNLHLDRGQDSNPCAWRPLGPQSMHGSTVPRFEWGS